MTGIVPQWPSMCLVAWLCLAAPLGAAERRQPPPTPPSDAPAGLMPADTPLESGAEAGFELPDGVADEMPDAAGEPLAEGEEPAAEAGDADELAPGMFDETVVEEYETDLGDDFPHLAGTCADGDCDACRNWYARVDFTLYHRTRSRVTTTTGITGVVFNSTLQAFQRRFIGTMTTKDLIFQLEPGARFTVGRYLGRDSMNRDHLFETSYHGITRFAESKIWHGGRGTDVDGVEVNDPNTIADDVHHDVGALISGFGTFAPGFSLVDTHQIQYNSTFHDLQFNRKIRRGLRRTRLVYSPGGWQEQSSPGFTPSVLGGLRFMQITEDFGLHARGVIDNVDVSGDYTITTHNHLFGAQTGIDLTQQYSTWGFGLLVRMGLYSNFANQNSLILVNDPSAFKAGHFPTGNFAYALRDRNLSFVGELGFNYNYRVNRALTFRCGYNLMWVTGLALAAEQIDYNPGGPTMLNHGGRTTFQGGSFGLEWVF